MQDTSVLTVRVRPAQPFSMSVISVTIAAMCLGRLRKAMSLMLSAVRDSAIQDQQESAKNPKPICRGVVTKPSSRIFNDSAVAGCKNTSKLGELQQFFETELVSCCGCSTATTANATKQLHAGGEGERERERGYHVMTMRNGNGWYSGPGGVTLDKKKKSARRHSWKSSASSCRT